MVLHIVSFSAGVKPSGAVDTIAIEKRHCRHLQFNGTRNERLRLRRAFEKAEDAGCMELDVAFSHREPPFASSPVPDRGPGNSIEARYLLLRPRYPNVRA